VTVKNVPDITHIKPLSKICMLQLVFPSWHRTIYIALASLEVFMERSKIFLEYDDAAMGNLLLRFQRNCPKCQESVMHWQIIKAQRT